jgi:hypothetical protein
MKKQTGDKWIITKAGIEYECEKMKDGSIVRRRKSAYTHPNRANGRSKDKVAVKGRTMANVSFNWAITINPSAGIKKSKPFDPETEYMHRVDSKTLVIRKKNVA